MSVASDIAKAFSKHGQSCTLRRRNDDGSWDEISVRAMIFRSRTMGSEDFDGESGGTRIARMSNAEIAASSLPDRLPRAKDQLVVRGSAMSVDEAVTQNDGDTVLMHTMILTGVDV